MVAVEQIDDVLRFTIETSGSLAAPTD
jgi:hypothetical protein